MKFLPLLIAAGALALVLVFSPQHHTKPCPGEKLGTSSIQEGMDYRTVAGHDMLMTFRDSIATGHTVDGVIGSLDLQVCTGWLPVIACHQSISVPTIPDVKPLWTISFEDDSHGVVTELNSEAGTEG